MLVIFSNFPFWQQGTSLLHQDTLAVMCLPSGDMPQSGCVVTFIWKPQSLRGQVHLLQYHNTFTNNCWCDLISAWHKVISYYWFRIQKWVAQGLPNLKWEVAQNSSRNRQVPLEVENEQSKSQHGVSHHTLSKPRIADLLTLQLHLTEIKQATSLEKLQVVETALVASRSTKLFKPLLLLSTKAREILIPMNQVK